MSVRHASALAIVCAFAALSASSALASSIHTKYNARAGWEVTATTLPTNIAPGGTGRLMVSVYNVGAANSEGPVTVTDTLPPGITATEAGENRIFKVREDDGWDCTGDGPGPSPGIMGAKVVTCTNDPVVQPFIPGGGGVGSGSIEEYNVL